MVRLGEEELEQIERRWRIDSWRLWLSIVVPLFVGGASSFSACLWFVANLNARVVNLESQRVNDQVQFTQAISKQSQTNDRLVDAVEGLKLAVVHLQDYYEQRSRR